MQFDLFINGKWVKPERYMDVELPYDGTVIAQVPKATPAELDRAIAAASAAKADAAARTPYERYIWLSRAAGLMEQRRDEFAAAITNESGKPVRESRTEVDRAVQTLIFSAEEAKRVHGELIPIDAHPAGRGRFGFTLRRPRGVIGCITPFNFPLNLVCHKVGPALAAGNTVVLKPAEKTPLSAHMVAQLFEQVGLPAGYLTVVCGIGTELGNVLVRHSAVNMVTFTGSAAVGAHIRSIADLKPVTLELGSNSAVIIDADADLDLAVERCRIGGFAHSGQVCIHLQRAYVNDSLMDDFRQRLLERIRTLKVGHPSAEDTDVSSLISPVAAERVHQWVGEAVGSGARALSGGGRVGRATILPTILENPAASSKVISDEIFGPVLTVNGFKGLDEAIALVNRSRYGLQAGVFTRDINKALHAAERLEVGGVMINDVPTFRVDHMPYGGSKDSGLGREGPKYAIEEMTELRTVVINRG